MLSQEILTIVKEVAPAFRLEPAVLAAFIEVESGGKGFLNGKILIQFEPVWMRRLAPYTPSGLWSVNKIDVQSKEWLAFNDAFRKDPIAAMQATSIGLGQIMGFHYKLLGYKSVGEMWDDAKTGLRAQVLQIAKFIAANQKLYSALKILDWHIVAVQYNGAGYKSIAEKTGREPYNISMAKAYGLYKTKF